MILHPSPRRQSNTNKHQRDCENPAIARIFISPVNPYQIMGRVIYDGTIEAEADALVPEAARILDQIFQDAKRNGELIRRLPSDVPPPDAEQWRNILQTLI